jgi:hypothetical protein
VADDSRTYVRIHDGMPDHPKLLEVGPAAAWLWVCGLCYCSRYLTDGRIPHAAVRRLIDADDAVSLAGRLVSAGLWEAHQGHYQVHDYLDHQRSAAEVKAMKEQRRSAGRRGGLARARNKQTASKDEANGVAVAKADAKQTLKQTGSKTQATTETQFSTSILKQPSVVGALAPLADASDDDPDAQQNPPPRASRDDRLRRAEAACDLLADQAHAAAVARGVVRTPANHRRACGESARADYLGEAQLIAHANPRWSPAEIAAAIETSPLRPQPVDNSEPKAGDLYRSADEQRRAREADAPAVPDWDRNRDRIKAERSQLIEEDPDHAS